MATEADILAVRRNTGEESATSVYTKEILGDLVDSSGVDGASEKVWRWKAARYARLVNISEAGASHAFSDLHKAALLEEKKYRELVATAASSELAGTVVITQIERA